MKIKLLRNLKIEEFIEFCTVGAICTAIDAGVFYAIHNLVGYRVAMVCGFALSIIPTLVISIITDFLIIRFVVKKD